MQPLKYDDLLTEHWKVSELCRPNDWPLFEGDQHLLDNIQRLASSVLEPLRVLYGRPIRCISGYRSPAHNAEIHGAGQSQHMLGKAADIVPAELDWVALHTGEGTDADATKLAEFLSLIEHHLGRELDSVGGIGAYPAWVHLDIRPQGSPPHIARWFGNGFGSEQ